MGGDGGHEFDGAACRPEGIGPERTFSRPVDQRRSRCGEKVLALYRSGFRCLHKAFILARENLVALWPQNEKIEG